ncbi:DUF2953 domain-containing protein [Robertmurraya massiliosenegalensis]|uniref:DUF2953 domain-containing protein n=1 Tax=Robertmurraya TaxID=2837507 RepID=UPI0039A5CD22
MMWVFIALAVIVVLIISVMLLKLIVIIDYYHNKDDDRFKITFKTFFGLIKYKINVPVIKIAEDSPEIVVKEKIETGAQEKDKKQDTKKFSAKDILQSIQDMDQFVKHVVGLHHIIRSFLKKVTMANLEWRTTIGISDAAYTGMLTGVFWTVKGSLVGLLTSLLKVKTLPNLMVTPDFNRTVNETSFRCMIHFRIGHAIFAGIKLLKFWKGGKPHFKTKPLSILSGNKAKSV